MDRNYIACDMGGLLESAGFTPRTKYLASATKTLSFVKTGAVDRSTPAGDIAAAVAGSAAGEPVALASTDGNGDPSLN
jgi:hypothetical protein